MTIESEIALLRNDLARISAKLDRTATPIAPRSYNLKDASTVLGCSPVHVRNLIADGHLVAAAYPGMQAERVPLWSIDQFLSSLGKHADT